MCTQGPQIHVGTSGWSYAHWRGVFYPEDLSERAMLAYYARQLHSVEVNSTFYHLPAAASLADWCAAVPDNFLFSVKASRYVTHMKKLGQPEVGMHNFLERVRLLGARLGPVLLQLPPHWHFDAGRLEQFLASLDNRLRYAFELRDHSWLNPRCYALLREHGTALCLYELDGFQSPRELTAGFVYVRLHGPDGPYRGDYPDAALRHWASACGAWRDQGRDVFVYFDNDQAGYAVNNALRLQALVGG
jgi:uncharacterized protein YecE (DUF72 family)